MIIAIDAASTDLSVALAAPDGNTLAEDAWSGGHRQSAELLPRLLGLLDASGSTLADAGALAVGTGPGSFTGLRVAMSLAKGIAAALRRPIVGVPSLEAWLASDTDAVAAVSRAGAHEAYVLARGEATPAVVSGAALAALADGRPVVAPGELADAFGLASARVPRAAGALAALASRRLGRDPAGDDLRTLEPIYLRQPRGVEAAAEGAVRWL